MYFTEIVNLLLWYIDRWWSRNWFHTEPRGRELCWLRRLDSIHRDSTGKSSCMAGDGFNLSRQCMALLIKFDGYRLARNKLSWHRTSILYDMLRGLCAERIVWLDDHRPSRRVPSTAGTSWRAYQRWMLWWNHLHMHWRMKSDCIVSSGGNWRNHSGSKIP